MAVSKVDPFQGLPRRSLFGSKATVISPAEVMVLPNLSVISQAPVKISQKRKRSPQPGKPFLVRLQPELVARILRWSMDNGSASVPEAIRVLIEEALDG